MKKINLIVLLMLTLCSNAFGQTWTARVDTMYGVTDVTIVFDVLRDTTVVMDNQTITVASDELVKTVIQARISDTVRRAENAYAKAATWKQFAGTHVADGMLDWKASVIDVACDVQSIGITFAILNDKDNVVDTLTVTIDDPATATELSVKSRVLKEISKRERVWNFLHVNDKMVSEKWDVK